MYICFFFHTSIFLQRLSDFDDESGDPSQIDLVLKFLQKVRKMFRGFKLKQLKHLANKKKTQAIQYLWSSIKKKTPCGKPTHLFFRVEETEDKSGNKAFSPSFSFFGSQPHFGLSASFWSFVFPRETRLSVFGFTA